MCMYYSQQDFVEEEIDRHQTDLLDNCVPLRHSARHTSLMSEHAQGEFSEVSAVTDLILSNKQ